MHLLLSRVIQICRIILWLFRYRPAAKGYKGSFGVYKWNFPFKKD